MNLQVCGNIVLTYTIENKVINCCRHIEKLWGGPVCRAHGASSCSSPVEFSSGVEQMADTLSSLDEILYFEIRVLSAKDGWW